MRAPTYEDYETVALVVLAIAFELAERRAPRARMNRGEHWRLDLAGVAALVLGVNLSRLALARLLAPLSLPLEALRALPGWLKIPLALVCVDFSLYWIHRAMHALPGLWRTHEWHHSIENLHWVSGLRTSLTHAFLYALPQVFFAFAVFRLNAIEAGIGFSMGIFTQLWTHANLESPFGALNAVIASPQHHRVHHRSERRLQGSNFGTFLTLWDRLFGTFVAADRATEGPLGLGYRKSAARMIAGV